MQRLKTIQRYHLASPFSCLSIELQLHGWKPSSRIIKRLRKNMRNCKKIIKIYAVRSIPWIHGKDQRNDPFWSPWQEWSLMIPSIKNSGQVILLHLVAYPVWNKLMINQLVWRCIGVILSIINLNLHLLCILLRLWRLTTSYAWCQMCGRHMAQCKERSLL